MRVIDAAPLPTSADAERIRVEIAQRVSGKPEHWDDKSFMDAYTRKDLSFAGVKCRVVGTYYLGEVKGKLALHFGGDISNYYPNRGLKVYKPRDAALARIVNFRDPERTLNHPLSHLEVPVGRVRYASTDRSAQGVDSVAVTVAPADLLDQKTALFGMTRTGKSNTAKIIAKSVFELRFEDAQKGALDS
ncbi:MAG: hypothetical protein M5U30_15580 [Burkholderiaceae bacterium]|nr:hypothetical protein [Burkholderiaceae bacterium]